MVGPVGGPVRGLGGGCFLYSCWPLCGPGKSHVPPRPGHPKTPDHWAPYLGYGAVSFDMHQRHCVVPCQTKKSRMVGSRGLSSSEAFCVQIL